MMITKRTYEGKYASEGSGRSASTVLILCVLMLAVVILSSLGLPKLFNIPNQKEPIAIIEDLDQNRRIEVGPNDTIGGNIQVIGVQNGKIELSVINRSRSK